MIQQIFCDGCRAGGSLPVRLEYEYRNEWCEHCRQRSSDKFTYYFCTPECFGRWVSHRYMVGPEELKEKVARFPMNFPCRSCDSKFTGPDGAGWAFGFKENGPCKTCGGKGVVG